MSYNKSKPCGYWHNLHNVAKEMKTFTTDKPLRVFKENKTPKNTCLKVEVMCENGHKRVVMWGSLKKDKGNCTCKKCKESKCINRATTWKDHLDYMNYFALFNITPIETPCDTKESVFSFTQEGYRVLASVCNLQRSEKNKNYNPNFDKFGIRNKYQIPNLKVFCKLERPDYQVVDYLYEDNVDVKKEIYFKYIGNNLKPNICRYFKTSIDHFIHGKVNHPALTMSKGEMRVKNYLDFNKIKYSLQYTDNRCKNKKTLRFDFAIYDKNKLIGLIEFDGHQHDYKVNWWGGFYFESLQNKDAIKNKFCEENNIPLLRIKQNRVNTCEKQLKVFIDGCKKENKYKGGVISISLEEIKRNEKFPYKVGINS